MNSNSQRDSCKVFRIRTTKSDQRKIRYFQHAKMLGQNNTIREKFIQQVFEKLKKT